jgi:hypothetical protein
LKTFQHFKEQWHTKRDKVPAEMDEIPMGNGEE